MQLVNEFEIQKSLLKTLSHKQFKGIHSLRSFFSDERHFHFLFKSEDTYFRLDIFLDLIKDDENNLFGKEKGYFVLNKNSGALNNSNQQTTRYIDTCFQRHPFCNFPSMLHLILIELKKENLKRIFRP